MQAFFSPALIGAAALATSAAIYKYLLPEKFSYERVAAPYISSQNAEEIKAKLDPKNMKHYWYPVCYSTEITKDNVKGIHLLGEPLCLYRDKTGRITCVLDRCPHRSAPLSIGKKLSNGNLECVYHGWQFSTNGAVERIPAVSKNSTMPSMIQAVPKPVHEELGYIWVWPGPVELAHPDFVPRSILKETGQKGWATMTEDGMDLNVEHGLMMDNLLDNAHVDFTHDKTIGNRNLASAIRQREITDSEYAKEYPGAFAVEMSFPESTHKTRKIQTPTFTFIPPCFIRLSTPVNQARTYHFTQVMLCIPSSKTKMRLMYRFFTDFLPAWVTKIPLVRKMILKSGRKIVAQDFELLDGITKNLQHGAPVLGNLVGADIAIKKYREWREASESHVDPWFNCSWGGNSCRKEHIVKKGSSSSTAASTTSSDSVNDIEDLLS